MPFTNKEKISHSIDEQENKRINFLGLLTRDLSDGELDIKELLNLEQKIKEDNINISQNLKSKLKKYEMEVLKKGINISPSNKDNIFAMLRNKGISIGENLQNKQGNFSVNIDKNNNLIEEGFFLTSLNNDEIDVKENDFEDDFNSLELLRYLDDEGKEIINDGLLRLENEALEHNIPEEFINKIKNFVKNGYDKLNNKDKLLMVTSFNKILKGDYNGALEYFELEFTKGYIIDQVFINIMLITTIMLITIIGGALPLWVTIMIGSGIIGGFLVSEYKYYKDTEEKVHFNNLVLDESPITGSKKPLNDTFKNHPGSTLLPNY